MLKKRILLHTCCAPCASASSLRLIQEDYDPVLFFSNSNISPEKEYYKRLETAHILAKELGIKLLVDEYNHESWLNFIKGLEKEKEQGKRCEKCFEFSLRRAYKKAQKEGIQLFTTSLTISPHKISKVIFALGKNFPGFVEFDFKKKDGYLQSIYLSKEYGLYRQNYCGCEFSLKAMKKEDL